MYVYIVTEPNVYTVGFYDPIGNWHPHEDFATRAEAAKCVSYLNGNGS